MINLSTQNPQSSIRIRNKSIDGFTMAVIYGGSGNLSNIATDLTQLQLKGTLRRNGSEVVMFNSTAKNLLIMSLILNPLYYYIAVPSVIQNTVAGPTQGVQPFRFDFGGAINLIGNDEFILEWQLNSTFFAATNLSLSASYVQIDECETTDIEYFTPIFTTQVIEANQQNPSFSLGDNVLSVILANYDKTDYLTTTAVVNNIKLSGKSGGFNVSKNDNFFELMVKSASYYQTIAEAAVRLQNWILWSGGDELDGASLDLNLNTANVTSSKNFVLTRSFITSDWLVTRGLELKARKDASADNKGNYDESLVLGGKNSRN